jgi:hypothetical protein
MIVNALASLGKLHWRVIVEFLGDIRPDHTDKKVNRLVL